ncbi:hypothetical protein LHJ74_26010 [Streptomyces sp. N2-109]|uniref:Lipoprotein n=1 Tax=Streptomyces gossypii TaxID=2883101 RepID=A0ABT2K1H7_9ACTN|nr:hypothetical protein [Streptomyces gossypii]MCT2593319.1 hypothetical protein [Streptomyces gossypii]
MGGRAVGGRRPGGKVPVPPAAVCAALALLAALSACGGPSEGQGDARSEIRRLLARQAEAVIAGDEGGYLAAVDPHRGAADYRAAQRRAFGNLRELPLAEWTARVTEVEVQGSRAEAEVRLRYRIRGYDEAPLTATEQLVLTRRDDGWFVTQERGGSPRQLWEQGKVTVLRGERSLVLGVGAGTEAERGTLRGIAAAAERAVPAVSQEWPHPWAERVIVEVPGSLRGMGELLGAPPESYEGTAAVTRGEGGRAEEAPADRIVVNPEAYGLLNEDGRQLVMTHETLHVATRAHTSGSTPLWLSEGLADWFGYRGTGRTPREAAPELARAVPDGRVPDALPRDRDFRFGGGPEELGRAYEGGWLACRMIEERWGQERLMAFYSAVGGQGKAERDAAVERALRDVLGVSPAEFTAQWRAYLRAELS